MIFYIPKCHLWRRGYFSHFLVEKVTLGMWVENTLIFVAVRNSINKSGVVMVSKGYNNALLVIFISVCALPIINLDIFRLG